MRSLFLCILACWITPLLPGADVYNPTALTEGDKAFFRDVRTAILNRKPEALAKLVLYPITIEIRSRLVTIESEREFVRRYADIVTPELENVILSQKEDELFKNWRGVMIGRGELWFEMVRLRNETAFRHKIIGLRTTAVRP